MRVTNSGLHHSLRLGRGGWLLDDAERTEPTDLSRNRDLGGHCDGGIIHLGVQMSFCRLASSPRCVLVDSGLYLDDAKLDCGGGHGGSGGGHGGRGN